MGSDGLIYVGKKIKSNSEDNKFLGLKKKVYMLKESH